MNNHLTRNGKEFTIRRAGEKDAENIINYAKILFSSTDQVLTTLPEYTITVEEEKVWINNSLKNPASIILIAEMDNAVVGLLDFSTKNRKKMAHIGEFGVSVHPGYQGNGIGQKLIETLLEWAKNNRQIEKVFLNVFATNQRAINLYKKLGFTEEGRHIKAIKQLSGEYTDIIQMYIETK
ncbi:MAG: GNAT family N-acetyltransferase [Bacteroidota bacterium]|nr:GNAT family N-acetyltransferase [Bacteroidota bacterium]